MYISFPDFFWGFLSIANYLTDGCSETSDMVWILAKLEGADPVSCLSKSHCCLPVAGLPQGQGNPAVLLSAAVFYSSSYNYTDFNVKTSFLDVFNLFFAMVLRMVAR